jgi:hypothetical protein
MKKLTLTAAATMLLFSFVVSAAPDPLGNSAANEAGAIYEWVDDAGLKHASDTVPDRYKSVAKRLEPSRFRIPAAEQAEAERQAAAIKASAASAASRSTAVAAQPSPARAASPGGSSSAPSASECAAMRKRFTESQECFVGFSNPDGTSGFHSCVNEPVPDPEPVCGRN